MRKIIKIVILLFIVYLLISDAKALTDRANLYIGKDKNGTSSLISLTKGDKFWVIFSYVWGDGASVLGIAFSYDESKLKHTGRVDKGDFDLTLNKGKMSAPANLGYDLSETDTPAVSGKVAIEFEVLDTATTGKTEIKYIANQSGIMDDNSCADRVCYYPNDLSVYIDVVNPPTATMPPTAMPTMPAENRVNGAECINNTQCASGYCSGGKCTSRKLDGSKCADDPDAVSYLQHVSCLSGYCGEKVGYTFAVCISPPKSGRPINSICNTYSDCASNYCDMDRKNTDGTGVCSYCNVDRNCDTKNGFYCANEDGGKICKNTNRPSGYACTNDSQCASNKCENNKCTAPTTPVTEPQPPTPVTYSDLDSNKDGVVDCKDYLNWKNAYWGNYVVGIKVDFNKDGEVNLLDFEMWRSHVSEQDKGPEILLKCNKTVQLNKL